MADGVSDADRLIALSRLSSGMQEEVLEMQDKDVQEALLNLIHLGLIEEAENGFKVKDDFE